MSFLLKYAPKHAATVTAKTTITMYQDRMLWIFSIN